MTEPKLLIATIGVPGAGKSTVIDRAHCPVVSSTAVRVELTGDPFKPRKVAAVWIEVHRRVADHLTRGSVVLDATNLDPAHRAPLLVLARDAGAVPVAWRLTTPPGLARTRNMDRDREGAEVGDGPDDRPVRPVLFP